MFKFPAEATRYYSHRKYGSSVSVIAVDTMGKKELERQADSRVLFIDVNSFFATCEQQMNFWLRGRSVGVCVYTGEHDIIIS